MGLHTTQTMPCHPGLIATAVIGINIQTMAIYSSFPVFYHPLRDKYDACRETIGWAFSIMGIVSCFAGIICSPFIKRYGCRNVLFIGVFLRTAGYLLTVWPSTGYGFNACYGIVIGVGFGAARISINCVLMQSFSAHRDLMTRLCSLGYYIGDAVGPLVANKTLQQYGLEGSLVIQAGIQAQGFVFAMLLPRLKTEPDKPPLKFTWTSCKLTLLVQIVNAAHDIGETGDRANSLPALMSITALGFGAVNVVLAKWLNPMAGFMIGMASASLGSFLVPVGTYPTLAASMILLGCDEGISFPSMCILLHNTLGDKQFGRGLALTDLAQIPAFVVSGPLAGLMADYTGSYRWTFITSGIIGIISLATAVITHILGKRRHKNHIIIKINTQDTVIVEEKVRLLEDSASDSEDSDLEIQKLTNNKINNNPEEDPSRDNTNQSEHYGSHNNYG